MSVNIEMSVLSSEGSASAPAGTGEEETSLSVEQDNSTNLTPPVKKDMSIKFVSEMSASALARIVINDAMANKTSADICTKLHNHLPSNTHQRRKLGVIVPEEAVILPRRIAPPNVPSATRMRKLLYPTKERMKQVDSLDLPSMDWSEQIEKEMEMPDTEEERIDHLQNIRSIPIKLEHKKLYRKNLMEHISVLPKAEKKCKSCSDACLSFLKGCVSFFVACLSSRCQLWSSSMKKIEGQFGTGVVSYFVFLRWLILLNFVSFVFCVFLIILPYSSSPHPTHRNIELAPNEMLLTEEYLQHLPSYKDVPFASKRTSTKNDLSNFDKRNFTGNERKRFSEYCEAEYKRELANHTTRAFSFIQDFLQGTGWLQSTILFLGFYPNRDVSYFGFTYPLSYAFIGVLVASFLLSFVLMVLYSSDGIQERFLIHMNKYPDILFCSWDYCIDDEKTAAIRHKSITYDIKRNLAEERKKLEVPWSSDKKRTVHTLQVIINILVIAIFSGCFYLIYMVVNIQLEKQRMNELNDSGVYIFFIQYLSPLVITGLNVIMPFIFYNTVKFEMYDTQTQVNITFFRIVFLRLASVFVLVCSLQQQITCEPKDVCKKGLDNSCRSPTCWETYIGQQFYKLVITDFLVYVCMFLGYYLRKVLLVRNCKCIVSEGVGRQVFDLPSQVLCLVYSQTLSWLGLFYSPLLPGISVLKFLIIFYMKKVVVLKHCAPPPVLDKTSRSNPMFMTNLVISLFFATVMYGYSLTSIETSLGCSPFRQHNTMMNAVSERISEWSPTTAKFMASLFSGFFFFPSCFLLSLVISFYWTVSVDQQKMLKLLKDQILVEGRDKLFVLNRMAEYSCKKYRIAKSKAD